MQRILIIGSTSAIAEATARLWAARRDTLFLVGRKPDRLDVIAADLRVRGATSVGCYTMDACDTPAHAAMLEAAVSAMGGLDVALIAHGSLPDQKACEVSVDQTLKEIDTNGLSVIALATLLGEKFAAQGSGSLAVIGSVAGDRGRQSNYVYGAAKGMVSLFLQAGEAGSSGVDDQAGFRRYADDSGVQQGRSLGKAGRHRARHRAGSRSKVRRSLSARFLVGDHDHHPAYSGADIQEAVLVASFLVLDTGGCSAGFRAICSIFFGLCSGRFAGDRLHFGSC